MSQQTIPKFKTIQELTDYCYHQCADAKAGCMYDCKVREETRKHHPT